MLACVMLVAACMYEGLHINTSSARNFVSRAELSPTIRSQVGTSWNSGNQIPSGKHTKNDGKIHHFQWVNPLFLWSWSIAMLNYQRVCQYGKSTIWIQLVIFSHENTNLQRLSQLAVLNYGSASTLAVLRKRLLRRLRG